MTEPVRYHLNEFPPTDIEWAHLVPLIGRANAALARYDSLVAAIPNANVLLSPLVMWEAVLSSKIEGINITMSKVLEIEAGTGNGVDRSKRDDAEEILNYRRALNFAAQTLKRRSLSHHLIRQTHELLMQGIRGRDKNPGTFRDQQNWTGPRGCTIDQASFVPIPQEHLLAGFDRWIDYVQNHNEPDPPVQLAIIHLEFEALHPFTDGNGRLGRMLIPLFLSERRILSGPHLYMNGYLEVRRDQYVDTMRTVSQDGDWTGWCAFFLEGMIEQASENQGKAQAIIGLNARMQHDVAEITHSQFSGRAVEFIFSRPIFSTTHFVKDSGIPRGAALRMLRVLRDDNARILRTVREGAGSRPTILAFPALLSIAEGKQVL